MPDLQALNGKHVAAQGSFTLDGAFLSSFQPVELSSPELTSLTQTQATPRVTITIP